MSDLTPETVNPPCSCCKLVDGRWTWDCSCANSGDYAEAVSFCTTENEATGYKARIAELERFLQQKSEQITRLQETVEKFQNVSTERVSHEPSNVTPETVNFYSVRPTKCDCHPETCACLEYTLYGGEHVIARGQNEAGLLLIIDRIAKLERENAEQKRANANLLQRNLVLSGKQSLEPEKTLDEKTIASVRGALSVGTGTKYAAHHRLAVTTEWIRGWNAHLDAQDAKAADVLQGIKSWPHSETGGGQ